MDDEEIARKYLSLYAIEKNIAEDGDVSADIECKAAIRLYRMAEEQTASQFAIQKSCGTSVRPTSAEVVRARASERESVLYDVKSELLAWANQITESQDTIGIQNFAGYLMVKLEKKKED